MKRDFPRDRPPPLKITRPDDPLHHQHQYTQDHQPQHAPPHAPFRPANPHPRQPVIIHTYSPVVHQIDSENFRQLVQQLTGPASQGSSSHAPPPPKRPRVAAHPTGNFKPNFSHTQGSGSFNPPPIAPHPGHSPRFLRMQHEAANPSPDASIGGYGNLPHNPLLSPSRFDFSPSVLPSPSTFSFDFSSVASPMGLLRGAGLPSPRAPGGVSSVISPSGLPTPHSLAAALPSPGPLSASFLADLPVLSPAASSWVEKNAATADAIWRGAGEAKLLTPRGIAAAGLPPRPPPTTTANLFPAEEYKPLAYREK